MSAKMVVATALALLCGHGVFGGGYPDAKCASISGWVIGSGDNVGQTKADDEGACCSSCQGNSKCKSWTFHSDQKACWLHSSTNHWQQRDDKHTTSGVPQGPLPPAPAPPAPMGKPSGPDACTPGTNGTKYKFCDDSLSVDQRVDALVDEIQVSEIGHQLTARQSYNIDRLGLPTYYWGTNAIHGVQNINCLKNGQCPTSFPAPCSLSASFDMSLVEDMGNVIGRELRAYYNAKVHNSLDTWSPTININRDPRWGRNVESPGEDPFLAGQYGSAYTRGLQQYTGTEDVVQAVVTIKHFLAYSIESYHGVQRYNVDVKVSAYDLANTYMPGWKEVITNGKALGVMCSYNAVNGLPTCANPELNRTLRETWGFEGYMTSDSDSCACIKNGHPQGHGGPPRPTNGTDATRQCLMGGTDIDSGGTYIGNMANAIQDGELDIKYAKIALHNSYKMRFKMGLFDPTKHNKYTNISTFIIGNAESQDKSLNAARKGMVLLKQGPLPFPKGHKVAVIGQSVTNTMAYTGNYDGPLCAHGGASCFPNLVDAVNHTNANGAVTFYSGTDPDKGSALAKDADYVILLVDNARDGGGEGHDRETIALSSAQIALADAVIAANSKTVLVLVNGGMISIDHLTESAPAILEAFMPGVHGGYAMAQTIFGESNPGGKLPVTMYHSSYVNVTDFLSMDMSNRSYRYYTGEPLYPFGFGLSYTTFSLKWTPHPPAPFTATPDTDTVYKVEVTNTGPMEGDEVVLAYVVPKEHSLRASLGEDVPIERKRLFGFQRVSLKAGDSTTVMFTLKSEDLAMVDAHGHKSLHPGKFDIVFSRGHGDDLSASAIVTSTPDSPVRLDTFRQWW